MQRRIYVIFLWFYQAGIRLAALWNPKARLWVEGRRGLSGRLRQLAISRGHPVVWMHCASLGEFEQGRPVIERLKAENPGIQVVISFFSPSGYEVMKQYEGANHILYLPADSPANARLFVDAIRPDLVLWIKYEYWYFYLQELAQRKIPLLLVSAVFAPRQPFFRWYGGLHREMLQSFSRIFVQNEESLNLLGELGLASRASLAGDTRFDRVVQIAGSPAQLAIIEKFCAGHPVLVAGSTWEEDEEVLDHYANAHPEIRFVIAPHEVDEDRIRDAQRLFRRSVRYSALSNQTKEDSSAEKQANVLIVDQVGLLSRIYRLASISYVGGGFGDDGVHNVLEAAVYGRPVVFGPVFDKYAEATELVEAGGALAIENALEAEKVFDRLLADAAEMGKLSEAAKEYVFAKKGATETVTRYIYENRLLTS